jgi:flagellar assembly factor FliW
MQLETKHFGTIEIDEKDILNFTEGIPGFEEINKFVLLGKTEEESPFQWMQGIDNTDVAFIVIDPRVFKPDYFVDVYEKDIEELGIKDENKILIYCIVVVPEDISKITANLKAPILINVENNRGKQVVLENGNYQIKHYIMEELRKIGG